MTRYASDEQWVRESIRAMRADQTRSSDTHLQSLALPPEWGIDLYLKDESVHPTGSLKHRLARSLILYGLVNGEIGPDTTLVESSSGSTAVSIAYFARLLGVRFVAVMPRQTSKAKVRLIELYGGTCEFVERSDQVYERAEDLGAQPDWFYLDQFSNAGTVTDWRGNNNIAESIFTQMRSERHSEPSWIVVGAGTGGTSATIGRYCRYVGASTRLCVVDPDGSAFYEGWKSGNRAAGASGSRIEGIGRPRVEPSFEPKVIDHMIKVSDGDSIAAMRWLSEVSNTLAGPSTGTNLVGAFQIISSMRARGQSGSVVTLVCDTGMRYGDTYYDDTWVEAQGIDLVLPRACIEQFLDGDEGAYAGDAPPEIPVARVELPVSGPARARSSSLRVDRSRGEVRNSSRTIQGGQSG